MNFPFLLPLWVATLVFAGSLAHAEVKGSSRNLQPLTKKTGESEVSSRSGNTGLGVKTQPSEKPAAAKASFTGPKSGWGFLQARAPYYSPAGKNLGSLPGGTCFKYAGVETASDTPLLVSTVRNGDRWEGPYLLGCHSLALFEGSPDALDAETFRNLAEYFTLLGKIAERKAALAQTLRTDNPHAETAQRARQAYQASIEKAGELEQQRTALSGARKTKADDDLRALKYEQVRLKADADRAVADYTAWNAAHPISPSKQAADPQLRELEQALQASRVKVSELVPQS